MTRPILHQSSWSQTAQGTCLEMHSQAAVRGPSVLFIGGVHGDEPEGVFLAQQLLGWLRKNPTDLAWNWNLIPCFNPDGYAQNMRTNSKGVDLNRNFPTATWSPEHKADRYFPGPSAGSELEVQALAKWLRNNPQNLIVHFHSWEPCVVYTGPSGKSFAEIIAGNTGFPVREDIGYPTPGSLGEFGWSVLRTPVVCIESPESIDSEQVWSLFGTGLIDMLRTEAHA